MIARPGAGALWTQTAALLLFAPASFVGDWIRGKKMAHTVNQQISRSAIEK
jgi:phosphate/sulfate permease